jgi:hypothetical protein
VVREEQQECSEIRKSACLMKDSGWYAFSELSLTGSAKGDVRSLVELPPLIGAWAKSFHGKKLSWT